MTYTLMANKTLAITTDLGDQFATAQLRAVISGLGFGGTIIENHHVHPYQIREGAYGIWQLAKFCHKETVFLGVVDPGVGSVRAGIIIKTTDFWFVGPDNGLLWPAAEKNGILKTWKIDETNFGNVAQTFHGRDVFVKAAVWLSAGQNPTAFGSTKLDPNELQRIVFVNGEIIHIDHYGNVKFFWDQKLKLGDELFGVPVVRTFSDVPNGEPLILNGSSDLLELAINLGSAREMFGLKLGDVVKKLI